MSWSIGFDNKWNRDIGYGVPAYCDHPECNEEIDRGLSYVCCGEEPRGGDGCGLYFCELHRGFYCYPPHEAGDDPEPLLSGCCERCSKGESPFTPKPEHPEWLEFKETDESWQEWRDERDANNPAMPDSSTSGEVRP